MSPNPSTGAYTFYGQDNDSYFYAASDVDACPSCGLVNDPLWVNPLFVPKRRKYDVSHTYDGVRIVSQRFADLVHDWPGADLTPLPAAPGFYRLLATQIVQFDEIRGVPNRTHVCEGCGRYTQVAKGHGWWLQPHTVVPDGLARTDLVVGSAMDSPRNRMLQHPLDLVNSTYAEKLEAAHMAGLYLKPVRIADDD